VYMSAISKFERLWGDNWVTGRWLLPLLEAWGKEIAGVVVDVGCGESPFRHYFKRASAYVRIDRVPSEKGVIHGDLRSLPFYDNTVDAVLLFQVLADLPDPIQALHEVRRVLRPGGKVIVFESMAYPEHDMPDDYYRIMPAGLEWIADRVGLETDRTERLGGLFTRWTILLNKYLFSTMSRLPLMGSVALFGKGALNLICFSLDRILVRPSLASDYLTRLTKPGKLDIELGMKDKDSKGI